MLQWAPKIDSYLDIMYSHAAPITNPLCTKCGKGEAIWRCASCRASPLFCANCCRTEHEQRPFHRIEMWTGSSFEPSWLWKVGTCLYSGHGGAPCPKLPPMSFPTHTAEEYQEHAKSSRDNLNDVTFGASPAISGKAEHAREVVVVHTNGVHQLLLHPCQCEGRKSEDLQVMEIGLYPSTSDVPAQARLRNPGSGLAFYGSGSSKMASLARAKGPGSAWLGLGPGHGFCNHFSNSIQKFNFTTFCTS
jgi:CxC2 like cysteine cluster associated with KDZ transposases